MKKFFAALGGLAAAAILIIFFFAPAFRGDNEITPVIQLGTFGFRYYGLIIGTAVVVSYFVARNNAWRFGIAKDEVDKFSFWAIIVAFISARLYFVIFDYGYYFENPSEIVKIWNGGLSVYGALIGGVIFTILYARGKIFSAWQLLDLAALALPLGQAIGRFGNFFNYEAYGSPTNLPWRMFVPEEFRGVFLPAEYFHPTFLYEATADILIFASLWLWRGKIKSGNLFLIYLMAYSAIRFAIEPMRLDSVFVMGFRADQIMALIVFLTAGSILVIRRLKEVKKT